MYGIPADLDLTFLNGAELIQVCLGCHQVQFHFHPAGSISVHGGWELRDEAGVLLDQSQDGPDRPPYQLHRLLGRAIVGTDVSAPKSFALRFAGGDTLRMFDDSGEFESFEIQPTGIIV